MSRLIVKNLPTKISDDKLKTLFQSLGGVVTDVQLKYTKEGKFRHFAFVGFAETTEADKARKHFDKTFVGATKVSVELCADLGDKDKPRAWSKYSSDSSAFKERNKEKEEEEKEETEKEKKKRRKEEKRKNKEKVNAMMDKFKEDPKFQEFLRIHKRNTDGVWNNEAILELGKTYEAEEKEPEGSNEDEGIASEEKQEELSSEEESEGEEKAAKNTALSDLDYLKAMTVDAKKDEDEDEKKEDGDEESPKKEKKKKQENDKKERKNEEHFTVKISGLPAKCKKSALKEFFKPLKIRSLRQPPKIKGIAFVGFGCEADRKRALMKNKSFVAGKQVLIKIHVEKSKQPGDDERWQQQEDSLKDEETVAESGRIFVRNLAYTVTEDTLEEHFKQFGPLTEINLPIDRQTRKSKGFAFVTYMMPENAVTALAQLDGTTLSGRLLHLLPGKAKQSAEELANAEGLTFKQKKELKEKAQAGSSHNWNTLFLGASAVADLMAEKYEVGKSDVLIGGDNNKQSAAVRLALGETQIVAETKGFLEEQGISLDAFSRPPTQRSKTVILIKNLPAKTPVDEIREMFAKHGELGRVVLPPSGITAIVEYFEPTEARKAFRSLAYTKFKNTPLYLEWAPDNSFTSVANREEMKKQNEVMNKAAATEVDDDAEPETNTTIYVKNLSFDTDEDSLRAHFAPMGALHAVTIAKKRDLKTHGEMLSMGYGFIQFKLAGAADKSLKSLQHKSLDGHSLELKRSTRATSNADEVQTSRKRSVISTTDATTTIHVKNIPFEAHTREVEDVFKTFGELKSCRLPKKATGSHRGFAFVQYHSKEDAKKAFEALCHSTHLYARRLVLEWAKEEETIDDLRRKTASKYSDAPQAKRVKKADVMESMLLGDVK